MVISNKELSIYQIKDMHSQILKDIESLESPFILDFKDVEKIDLSNIQLFLSLKKYCFEKNIEIQTINIKSKQVKQIFRLFNLNDSLGVS